MANLQDLQIRISGKIKDALNTAVTLLQVTQSINDAIDHFENDLTYFNQATATMTCTVNNPVLSVGLPNDFDSFSKGNELTLIDNSGVTRPLVPISSYVYDLRYSGGSGQPYAYTYKSGQIILLWTPDQAYSMRLNYIKVYPDLVAPTDSNDWTVYAPLVIEYKALEIVYRDYLEQFDYADKYSELAKERMDEIRGTTYDRLATGFLTADDGSADEGYTHHYY